METNDQGESTGKEETHKVTVDYGKKPDGKGSRKVTYKGTEEEVADIQQTAQILMPEADHKISTTDTGSEEE